MENKSQIVVRHNRRATVGTPKKNPQCLIFTCKKKSDDSCCFYCDNKLKCGEKACKNDPSKCSQCMYPPDWEKGNKAQAMNPNLINDAPAIRQAERFGGMLNYSEVENPVCPECKEECLIVYVDRYNQVVGCDNCISSRNAASFLGRLDQ